RPHREHGPQSRPHRRPHRAQARLRGQHARLARPPLQADHPEPGRKRKARRLRDQREHHGGQTLTGLAALRRWPNDSYTRFMSRKKAKGPPRGTRAASETRGPRSKSEGPKGKKSSIGNEKASPIGLPDPPSALFRPRVDISRLHPAFAAV